MYKVHNKVIGSPPLNLFGQGLIQDGGMLFDGVSMFANAALPKSDCLQDPEACLNGFSVGVKLKFDQADMTYPVPKYIFDSGARSLTTRGISLYLMNGNLFVELGTAKKAWKVCSG